MKKIAHTLVGLLLPTLLTVLAACHRHDPYPAGLLRADSLCEVAPDSARSVLHAMQDDMDDAPLSTRMYHRLLCIKAADKAYVPITSDSAIRPVLRYYEHDGGDPALLPEALYYGGRTYRELGDAPQALDYFDRAINALPDGVDDGLKSNIYSQRGQLFIFQDMYPEAREMFRASLECDLRIQDSVKMVYAYSDIGFCFMSESVMDSAEVYYRKAYRIAARFGGKILRIAQIANSSFFTLTGQNDSAWTYIRPCLWDKAMGEAGKSPTYVNAFRYYYNNGRTDSAVYYAKAVLGFGTIYAKQAAYEMLMSEAFRHKRLGQLEGYWQGYMACSDSIQKLTQTETIRKMNALYNYSAHEQERRRSEEKYQRMKQQIFLLVLSTAGLLLLILFLWERSMRKQFQKANELYRQTEEARRDAKQARLECNVLARDLQEALTEKEKEHADFCLQINRYEAELEHCYQNEKKLLAEKRQINECGFLSSDVYHLIKKRMQMGEKPLKKELIYLKQELFTHYAECAAKLMQDYALPDQKTYFCLLLKAGFSVREIAVLTSNTEKGVYMAYYRICKSIGVGSNSIEKLKALILSL